MRNQPRKCVVRWIWFLLTAPALAAGEEAIVSGRVLDAETGKMMVAPLMDTDSQDR